MKENYSKGFAFILEGETEKEFYIILLKYLCKKYNAVMQRDEISLGLEVIYKLFTEKNQYFLIMFHSVNAISQVPRAGHWFESRCVNNYVSVEWSVFLCYDTDNYKEDISKFYEGDWRFLRQSLKSAKNVVDIAAAADIEDIMLLDILHVCKYLNCSEPENLKGRKGKTKMKMLFRDNGISYHEGKRARPLIEALDMEFLLNTAVVPLKEIENLIFKQV